MQVKNVILLASALAVAAATASAQTVASLAGPAPTPTPAPAPMAMRPPPPPPPLISGLSVDRLLPDLVGAPSHPEALAPGLTQLANELRDDGILLRFTLFDNFAANPVGGVRQSATNIVSESFGTDLDLHRILGIPGAQMHLTINNENGDSLAQRDIGEGIIVQGRWKGFHYPRLAIFTYEQNLFNDRVNVIVGRTFPLADFATTTFGPQFMSGATLGSEMSGQIQNGTLAAYPLSTWGTRIKGWVAPHTYVQAGAYEADNSSYALVDGFSWDDSRAIGVTVPVEIGYGTSFRDEAYPVHAKLGGWYNDFSHNDPFANTAGKSITLYGGTPQVDGPTGGAYVMADKVVYRPDSTSNRNLMVFAAYDQTASQNFAYHSQASVGLYWTGPFAARPKDGFGVAFNWYTLGTQQIRFLEASRAKVGGTGATSRNMEALEVNYGFQLASGVRFYPDIQYIVDPDTFYKPLTKNIPHNALVIGCYLTFNLGSYLGFPEHF